MEITMILGLALLGAVAGTISGLLGIGGAIIIIPALIYIFGFDQKVAQGTSLMLMVPPIGILGAMQYYKADKVDLPAAAIIATMFFLGGWLGSKFALKADPLILRRGFAVLMVAAAIKMWFK